MNKLLILILVISIAGNLVGLFAIYKFLGAKRAIEYVRMDLDRANERIVDLTGVLDRLHNKRMIFLHHSVGHGILYDGGLRDSMLAMGILVKGATYGDDIGQSTDVCDWPQKFRHDMDKIFSFKAHPNSYYSDGITNDIVTFKSCFPNSDITGEGTQPGDPSTREKTIANFKAAFLEIQSDMARHNDKLFIYVTAPPLVPEITTPENARRAREFNRWLVEEYLPKYKTESGLDNFGIFNLFDILADGNNVLKEEFRGGKPGDSHPNARGSQLAAREFMAFFRPLWERWQGKAQSSLTQTSN